MNPPTIKNFFSVISLSHKKGKKDITNPMTKKPKMNIWGNIYNDSAAIPIINDSKIQESPFEEVMVC